MRSAFPKFANNIRCHQCAVEGHFARDCPSARRVVSQPQQLAQQRNTGDRPQPVERVYAMSRA